MSADVLISDFADDPDMQEILVEFCDRLPATIERLEAALAQRELNIIQRIGHQMKGAGGGYGFSPLSEVGAQLEAQAKDGECSPALAQTAARFIQLCRAARPSLANVEAPIDA